jgi:NADH-dependent peroxiredoxin subunit C
LKAIEIVTEPIGRSTNELVRKIRALEFVRSNPGQACPATWNVGGGTLKPSIKLLDMWEKKCEIRNVEL